MKSALVQVQTSDNLLLPGLFFEPIKKTKKAAIYLHGMGSSVFRTVDYTNSLAAKLVKQNVAFLPFNNRGSDLIQHFRVANKRKKTSKTIGMTHEGIKDCVMDIDGAIRFLRNRGYCELYLIGHSTGANKICIYNFYKPRNQIKKYILLGGGDDTGLAYQALGRSKFMRLLKKAKSEIKQGKAMRIIKEPLYGNAGDDEELFSYRAVYDMLNPNGDYNTFPFLEAMGKAKLSTKPLFRHYRSITKPTLVVYGADDEYCYGKIPEIVELLKAESAAPRKFSFKVIPGADHSFYGKEKQLARTIAGWL